MHVTHDEQRLRVRVRQIRWEAHGVLSVEFDRDGGAMPPWTPGSHIDLVLPGQLVRQYSLCGDLNSPTWKIAVLRDSNSRGGSLAVHELLRVGHEVDIVGPRNHFSLVPAPSYLFIAGGIGITPLKPMIAAADGEDADWSLIYGGRTRRSMAFVDELLERYGGSVHIHPQDEVGLLDLPTYLGRATPGKLVYACGPEALLEAIERQFAAAEWPSGTLKLERFAPKVQESAADGNDRPFEIEVSSTGARVPVMGGQTILEALEGHGFKVANSCRQGICGTCETAVLEGVPDHRDSLLSDEERAANDTMMICVGRSLSPKLVLDL